ncbi:hypothetical protein B0I73DRAFT_130230 [Yarrowia lipolytica]|jgi:hypothetical protein|uniref:K Homology domain-containing protein n=1 Tax=Yarrowia lipolytica TaxID=4952 RepID=A0A371C342_YARLL|nr:Hypothetical protein YALI2_C01172g [Yarrowia lipolytica]RDW24410.1 hypothetical protein B0I71DRAFT_134317 [Yarrowia lipolytica]RDW40475.1 hypothetical protein B0I73DRAFT_130230 [Yarrowia lipolytica]RDW47692.1 hypothetical protein B0I74DRAFT_134811 [Yarrowia lipolytica]RDW53912.1 hypothetical protein B0I75DRAFT_135495 [Yarrowia lipolytica]
MIRRINTLASSAKTPDPAVILKSIDRVQNGANNGEHMDHNQQQKTLNRTHKGQQRQTTGGQKLKGAPKSKTPYKRSSNNRFRLFLQPFEVSALLRNRGEVIQQLRSQHNLYALNLSPFVNASSSRSVRIKCDSEENLDKTTNEQVARDAEKLSQAITDMYREIITRRPQRDADGLSLKPGSGQLRFSVTNSVAAKFDHLCNAMYGGRPSTSNSISVNKQLIPDSRDQLLIVNVKKIADLDEVARFVHELVMQEHQTPFKKSSDLPRAHILPRTDINYHSHTKLAQRGQFAKIRLIIPDHMVGTVIGRGGANIKQLRENSGAFISLKSDHDKKSVVQIVAQDQANVTQAIVELKQLLEQEWYSDKSLEEIEKIFLRAGYNV